MYNRTDGSTGANATDLGAAVTVTVTAAAATMTSGSSASGSGDGSQHSDSNEVAVGAGVGVPLGLALVAAMVLLLRQRRRIKVLESRQGPYEIGSSGQSGRQELYGSLPTGKTSLERPESVHELGTSYP